MVGPLTPETRRWRSLVEQAPETILCVDRNGMIEFINHVVPGLTVAEVVGRSHLDFLPEAEHQRMQGIMASVFATGEVVAYEVRSTGPSGEELGYYGCRAGPVFHEGKVESVVIVASNITEKRQMLEELQESRTQLRRLSARHQAMLEEERRHIARDLHDELGQYLTALRLELAALERRLEAPDLSARTQVMGGLIDDSLTSLRRISARLRPKILDDFGLGPALDGLLQDLCGRAGLQFRLNLRLGGPLGESIALAAFRICQEALTNVVRHAQAQSVEVQAELSEGSLRLCIEDDGIGIPANVPKDSLGLLGIQERAAECGGTVEITRRNGGGTSILARLPC